MFVGILFLLLLTIEIFGIVSFDSWMMCLFVQATCGGCHMVVLARPRDQSSGDVTLEEDDVTEDYLEKPYVELLGDTADSSTLQRSLSARVRRRERVGREQTASRYDSQNSADNLIHFICNKDKVLLLCRSPN